MKLETVEKKLGLTYPRAFRDIFETGALDWLWGKPQEKTHLFPNKLLEKEWYPYWNLCDFPGVEWSVNYLRQHVQADSGQWKEDVQVIPLAWADEGEAFFFNAALGTENSSVFMLTADGMTACVSHSFEEFICFHLCQSVLNRGLPADHWWIQNQLPWLTAEHQAVLTSGDPEALETLLGQTDCWEETDYISY